MKVFILLCIMLLNSSIILSKTQISVRNAKDIKNSLSDDKKYFKTLKEWQKKEIKVAYLDNYPPFIYKDKESNKYVGIVAELWQKIAEMNQLKYKLTVIEGQGKWDKIIHATASGEYDIGVGPFSVTKAREKITDFTRPWYINRFGFAIPPKNKNIAGIVFDIFGDFLILMLTGGLALLVTFSVLLWVFERKTGGELSGPDGIRKSFFIATACMLRDLIYSPKTVPAQLLIILWIVFSTIALIILTSLTTATLTYSLTLAENDIKDHKAFMKARISTYVNSPNIPLALQLGKKKNDLILVKTNAEAHEKLAKGKADAIMGGYISLSYQIEHDPAFSGINYIMSSYIPKLGEFAFPLPKGKGKEGLAEIINRSIKNLQNKGFLREVCKKYLVKEQIMGCTL